ncbi:buaE [Symbiodinium natans]|uniref:BuaE protein n=1 Tax=Symbiodinium natans TaxID=878477 RepID=A0A812LDH4_9DINO|nr:buaE [Symbiodinium natans]
MSWSFLQQHPARMRIQRSMKFRHLVNVRPLTGCDSAAHPHVDMSQIMTPNHPRRASALTEIRNALSTRGYFYASNVDSLPQKYIERVYAFARCLHDLPVAEKRRCARPKGTYSGSDAGVEELAYEAGSASTVRAWDFSRVRFPTSGRTHPEVRCPSSDLGFHDFLDDLYGRQDRLAMALMTAFAEMLDLPSDTFSSCFSGDDMGTIRLLHYPAATSSEEARRRQEANYGISPHTDFEAFTLMHQNAPGLQFLPPDGSDWVDAPVREEEFVVIVGDILERFTNGMLRATPHRVLQTTWERFSIIRFNAVTPETLVEPLAQFVTESRPARYTPVTMRKHMETTVGRLEQGLGAWEKGQPGRSLTANFVYDDPGL